MKKIILLSFCYFFIPAYSQNVSIPDANFKAALLSNTSINTNADGEIQVSEATAYTGAINVNSKNISDLTGIEAFIKLTSVDCGNNNISALNLTTDTALITLGCYNNQLTVLSLAGNNYIKYLYCQQNQLGNLDVSGNIALKEIRCNDNKLTVLNVKNGNNVNFTAFSAANNTGLTCIQVDNVAFMNMNWPNAKDPSAAYNLDCLAGITEEKNITARSMVYPNPSSGNFKLDRSGHTDEKICVYDPLGNCVWEKDQKNTPHFEIDLSSQSKGIYFMEIQSGATKTVKKIVVE